MMMVEIVHENGERYRMPVSQVAVFTRDGDPCAITYEHAGIIIHTDTEHRDFNDTCSQLRIKRLEPKSING